MPQIQPFIYGIKPTIIIIILAAIYPLAKRSLKSVELACIGVVVLIVCLLGYNEIAVMFLAGFAAMVIYYFKNRGEDTYIRSVLPLSLLQTPTTTLLSVTNANLFFIFLKIGAILFGSGYVLFAFLDNELVAKGILPRQQLIDAIAVGQFTPGPVFSSVTFIGYQLNGVGGAIVSTIGVFLPSFVFVAILNPFIPKMRRSKMFSVFLDAVNVASLAIIAVVCYTMGRESITDWRTILIAVLSILILMKYKLNSAILVAGSSLLGYALSLI